MKETNSNYLEIDLFRLLKALWHRAWAIALAVLLFGGVAFSYSAFLVKPLYQAGSMLYVNNSSFSVGSTSFSITSSELTAAQSLVNTYVVVLKSRATLETVIENADLDYSYEELVEMIDAHAVNGTEIFEVVVTSEDPQEAERIANTIARVLPEKISGIVDGSSVRVVDYAVIPSQKSSPNITVYTAVGILLGLAISCLCIILLEVFDDEIRDEDYLIQTYKIPVLASIPELLSNKNSESYYQYGSNPRSK